MDLGPKLYKNDGLFEIKHGFYKVYILRFSAILASKPTCQTHQKKASEPEIQQNKKSQFS